MRAACMVAFFGAERTHDCDPVRVLGQLRQVLAEPEPRHARLNLLEFAAVRVPRLHVERIGLTRAAAHPKQDTMPPAPRVLRYIGRKRWKPRRTARAQKAKPEAPQNISAVELVAA